MPLFTENFDRSVDENLEDSANWSLMFGTGTIEILAANDYGTIASNGTYALYRCDNGSAPTGDQEAQANCNPGGGGHVGITLRGVTTDGGNCYYCRIYVGNGLQIYRADGGVPIQLEDDSQTISADTAYDVTARADGTNPVVVEMDVDGLSSLDNSPGDSSADRKESGTPGVAAYRSGNTPQLEDFIINDYGAPADVYVPIVRQV